MGALLCFPPAATMNPSALPPPAQDILQFWFGAPPLKAQQRWFAKDAAFDAQIRERFGAHIEAALRGELDGWQSDAQAALARLLLLDQFTRNVFRDTPRAFAGDALALAGARALVDAGQDQVLAPLQRVFVYLPFEHAEDLAAQAQGLRLFEALARCDTTAADFEFWARKHHVIIERFGRFPHRNAVLGRESTVEEIEFLQQPYSRF
ncbi:DUF924 family protein [Azohydromonas lata]|uniref:DUF924 family protein n=1 Tax=Azohydromonas lata TaxID=45677 RepID=A0ABU5IF39_9BURK|nr:DUF924 family protein [Azohydromonas lata]MDZ5457706.1 DUF924 family protein [Azohydromonas lata]